MGLEKHTKGERIIEYWQPKVAEVSLFQVAELPTNWFDYTLPKKGQRAKPISIVCYRIAKCIKRNNKGK